MVEMSVKKIPWVATNPPSHIQPAKSYAATPISCTNRDVVPTVSKTLSPFGLFFTLLPEVPM